MFRRPLPGPVYDGLAVVPSPDSGVCVGEGNGTRTTSAKGKGQRSDLGTRRPEGELRRQDALATALWTVGRAPTPREAPAASNAPFQSGVALRFLPQAKVPGGFPLPPGSGSPHALGMVRPTLFLIHGMGGHGLAWDRWASRLQSRGFRCVAPTLPWHQPGDAEAHPDQLGRATLDDYVNFLAERIKAEQERDGQWPVLAGHSLGGLLAQLLAARGLARAAVLLAPAPPAGILVWQRSVFSCFPLSVRVVLAPDRVIRLLRPGSERHIFNRSSPEEFARTWERMLPESGRVAWQIGFWFLDWRRRGSWYRPAEVQCPVLALGASDDGVTPAANVRKIVRRLRHCAEYVELPQHSHWLLGETNWEEVCDRVADWIEAGI